MNISAAQVAILRQLLDEDTVPVKGDIRPWRGLVAVGLLEHDGTTAKLTPKGREFVETYSERLAKGKRQLTGVSVPRTAKAGAPRKRERTCRPTPRGNVHVPASRYEHLRAEIAARYEADLAALDRVIEIASVIEAQK